MKNVRFHLLSNKEGEKMKKLLFLLPAMAMMLAGCGAPSEDSSSTSGSSSTSSSTTTTQSSTGGGEHSGKVIHYDFNDVNEEFTETTYSDGSKGMVAPYINKCSDDGEVGFMKDHCKANPDFLVSGENTGASAGNANDSGAFPSEHGCVKMGSKSKEGVLSFTFNVPISKVEIACHDWFKKDSSHPTNSNKIDVNGDEKLTPYQESPTKTQFLTFDIEASEDVVITTKNRAFIFEIKLTVA